MQDKNISPIEYHKVLQDAQRYHNQRADIRNQTKFKLRHMTKEQREVLLKQGRKGGKNFLREISNASGIRGFNSI